MHLTLRQRDLVQKCVVVLHLNHCISALESMGGPKAQHFIWWLPGRGTRQPYLGRRGAKDSSSFLPLSWGLLGRGNAAGFSSLGDNLEDGFIS